MSCARMTRRVALIMFLGGLSVSAPVAAAETWVLWARPCDLAGQKCTGDWQRLIRSVAGHQRSRCISSVSERRRRATEGGGDARSGST